MQSDDNLHSVRLNEIASIKEAASRFGDWLTAEDKPFGGKTWNATTVQSPQIYWSTLWWITYEGAFREYGLEPWFQDGVKAYCLLALENECNETITFLRSSTGDLFVSCAGCSVFGVEEFLKGETLPIRHDPEFAHLIWDPVSAVGHIMNEYAPKT